MHSHATTSNIARSFMTRTALIRDLDRSIGPLKRIQFALLVLISPGCLFVSVLGGIGKGCAGTGVLVEDLEELLADD